MNPQLEQVERELEHVLEGARRLAGTVSEEEWQRPHPRGGWSPGACVTHLNISAREMVPRLRDAIERGRRASILGDGPFGMGLLARALCWFLEPPYRMRFATGKAFDPVGTAPKADVMAEFERAHDAVRACVRDADGLDLGRLTIVSPFDGRVRYNVYAALRIIPAHARRHLWQAERTVAAAREAAPATAAAAR